MHRKLMLALSLVMLASSACVVRAHAAVPVDAEVIVQEPPAPQAEVITVAPSPNHVWIKGHWGWHGRWVWENGYWETIRVGHVWVEGHWTRHRHGWVWVPGHWNRV